MDSIEKMRKNKRNVFMRVFMFYYDGFRNMTWGRVLWLIILIKLFIIFFVLRLFFFKPFLEHIPNKNEYVGNELIERS